MTMDKILDFIFSNSDLYTLDQREELGKALEKHVEYGTLLVLYDNDKIVGICRWNTDDWITFYVIDVIISKDYRFHKLLQQMVRWGKDNFPSFTYIHFERGQKKNNKFRTLEVKKFLKE